MKVFESLPGLNSNIHPVMFSVELIVLDIVFTTLI
jgi:hypothetical protein